MSGPIPPPPHSQSDPGPKGVILTFQMEGFQQGGEVLSEESVIAKFVFAWEMSFVKP